jgi:hypothetical protein
MEMESLLDQVIRLRDAGDRDCFDSDDDYKWVLHRLWIAIGNEARFYTDAAGMQGRRAQPWTALYEQRNELAHRHLSDIDDNGLWRTTVMRAEQHYRPAVRAALR